jgi:hypothetical protein
VPARQPGTNGTPPASTHRHRLSPEGWSNAPALS